MKNFREYLKDKEKEKTKENKEKIKLYDIIKKIDERNEKIKPEPSKE